MDMKISASEFVVMDILWREGNLPVIKVSESVMQKQGWEKSTVYTLISRLVKKGAIQRKETDFICEAAISKDEVRIAQTQVLLDKMYSGSLILFIRSFLSAEKISENELKELREFVDSYKPEG